MFLYTLSEAMISKIIAINLAEIAALSFYFLQINKFIITRRKHRLVINSQNLCNCFYMEDNAPKNVIQAKI